MEQSGESRLKKRQITLKDGRYMTFYMFEDEPASPPDHTKAERPEMKPQTQEKRRV